MLVRQAVTFRYRNRPTGGRTELGTALAAVLLRDYGAALGIRDFETGTDYSERDYARQSCYAMEWQVPQEIFARFLESPDGAGLFEHTPAIGKHRPILGDEVLENREIAVSLEDLVGKASGHLLFDYTRIAAK